MDHVSAVMADIRKELEKANSKFPQFNSAHEGRSVIEEEYHELTEHVYADTAYTDEAYGEAVQLGAMAAKFLMLIRFRQAVGRADAKGTK